MTKPLLLLLAVQFFYCSLFAQTFQWANRTGNTAKDEGISVATDASGNSYSTGSFSGTVDFDPGAGTVNLTSVGDNDIFVSKINSSGNLVWAKSFGSSVYDVGIDIAVDASGNVYTTGNFSGTVDFDPGAGTTMLSSSGGSDIFVSKLDANGNFLFARTMGGTTVDGGLSIAVDPLNNIYTTGAYSGTADMDPGAGVFSLSSLKGGNDIFIVKLNSSGNFLWANTAGGGSADQGTAIAVDATGNSYLTGFYTADANFNPAGSGAGGLFTAAGSTDIFVLKFATDGSFVWARSMGGTGADVGYGITTDGSGNVFTTGYFFGTADFDPGVSSVALTSAGTNVDIFISKLNASGNFMLAKNAGGTNGDVGYSISVDVTGNIYTYGAFAGTADFDPAVAVNNVTSAGLADVFILKLDAAGSFIWVKTFGGIADDIGYAMAMDPFGNMYTTGIFGGTADFNPEAGVLNLTSAGNQDIFNSKIGSVTIFPVTWLNFDAVKMEQDSYLTWKTATEINSDKFEVERSYDGALYRSIGEIKAFGSSTSVRSYSFTDKLAGKNYPAQNLYYRFKQIDLDGRFAYSPVRIINFRSLAKIQYYPNPVISYLTLKTGGSDIGLKFTLTDQLGRRLMNGTLSSSSTTINIQHFSAGTYFLRVGGACEPAVKILKQ